MKQPALVLCQLFKTGDNNSDHTQSNVSNSCSNRKHTPSCECNENGVIDCSLNVF